MTPRTIRFGAALTAAAALAAALVLPTAWAAPKGPQKKTVGVFDNYYKAPGSPAGKLTVNRNSSVKFVWDESMADVHDLKLTKAPKGVRQFASDAASGGYEYTNKTLKKLTRPGVYKFLCTFHENDGMLFTLTVRKR